MEIIVEVILKGGRTAVEIALFVLLPVMIVMLTLMRLLEARGVLDWLVVRIAPAVKPFGLSGLGVFAALQMNFVSFVAPVATLTMMEQRAASDRQLAATLAMVMSMAQANVSLPMTSLGLNIGWVLLWSVVGGLIAASITWHLFGRGLSAAAPVEHEPPAARETAGGAKGLLGIINNAGAESFKVAVGAIPMLVLALGFVNALRTFGAVDALTDALTPLLAPLHLNPDYLLPAVTKYVAGGVSMMGVMDDMLRQGLTTAEGLNRAAGFLINPFDLVGVAVLISAGPRVAKVWKVAACGAVIGIIVRCIGHVLVT
jgi:spore maturation protein SpmB